MFANLAVPTIPVGLRLGEHGAPSKRRLSQTGMAAMATAWRPEGLDLGPTVEFMKTGANVIPEIRRG